MSTWRFEGVGFLFDGQLHSPDLRLPKHFTVEFEPVSRLRVAQTQQTRVDHRGRNRYSVVAQVVELDYYMVLDLGALQVLAGPHVTRRIKNAQVGDFIAGTVELSVNHWADDAEILRRRQPWQVSKVTYFRYPEARWRRLRQPPRNEISHEEVEALDDSACYCLIDCTPLPTHRTDAQNDVSVSPVLFNPAETEPSLVFNCGGLPVEDRVQAAGMEANGYLWEGVLRFLAPDLSTRLEFDSESGMFCVYGSAELLEQARSHLTPYLSDPDRISELIEQARTAGFDLEDSEPAH